jgi:L-threonylcarbamoyladenylate synthase
MKHLRIDPQAFDGDALRDAADVLRHGGVVAYPTDTLYGLAVDPSSDAAVRRLFEIKGRDERSAIALIAADAAQAEEAGTFREKERTLAKVFWPGPLTIVVPMADRLSPLLSAARTVGVRVPDHAIARGLAAAFGGCLTATSANISGRPAANTADEVVVSMGHLIDVIVDGGPVPGGPPSTIVEIVAGVVTLHRAGATPWDRVLRCLQ